MKQSTWLGVGMSVLLAVGATSVMADQFRPERGVRCDESVRICYERGAPSVEMTERYFGYKAARRLSRDLRREAQGDGGRMFYPERGVRCDRAEQVCYDRRGNPSVQLTGEYLGSSAARRLDRRPSGDRTDSAVFSPQPGVRCNRAEQVCYYDNQPSHRLTVRYFGPSAAGWINR